MEQRGAEISPLSGNPRFKKLPTFLVKKRAAASGTLIPTKKTLAELCSQAAAHEEFFSEVF